MFSQKKICHITGSLRRGTGPKRDPGGPKGRRLFFEHPVSERHAGGPELPKEVNRRRVKGIAPPSEKKGGEEACWETPPGKKTEKNTETAKQNVSSKKDQNLSGGVAENYQKGTRQEEKALKPMLGGTYQPF